MLARRRRQKFQVYYISSVQSPKNHFSFCFATRRKFSVITLVKQEENKVIKSSSFLFVFDLNHLFSYVINRKSICTIPYKVKPFYQVGFENGSTAKSKSRKGSDFTGL